MDHTGSKNKRRYVWSSYIYVLRPCALGRFIVTVVAFVKRWCNIRRCHVERETPGATWSSYRKSNSPGRLSAVVVDLMNSLSVHKSVEMKSLFVLVGVVNTEGWIDRRCRDIAKPSQGATNKIFSGLFFDKATTWLTVCHTYKYF